MILFGQGQAFFDDPSIEELPQNRGSLPLSLCYRTILPGVILPVGLLKPGSRNSKVSRRCSLGGGTVWLPLHSQSQAIAGNTVSPSGFTLVHQLISSLKQRLHVVFVARQRCSDGNRHSNF